MFDSKRAIRFTLIWFFFFANSFISLEAMRWYESDINENILGFPYEVGIVLGGFSDYDAKNERMEFREGADRIAHAIRLYHEKKIKKIMVSGGSGRITQDKREASYTAAYLMSLGIPARDIIVEKDSRNTYENIILSKRMLANEGIEGKILLITSAFHMPRSMAIAAKAGLEVSPFPVDHYAGDRMFDLETLLVPQAEALARWNILTHEWIGYAVYKIKGYL